MTIKATGKTIVDTDRKISVHDSMIVGSDSTVEVKSGVTIEGDGYTVAGTQVFTEDAVRGSSIEFTSSQSTLQFTVSSEFPGSVSGYTSGGAAVSSIYDTIDKFPFSADANATDVGNLTQARYGSSGQSSSESGYTGGGTNSTFAVVNTIDKFPFAANANATDVGDLTVARETSGGQSSTVSGYTSGGADFDAFPFISYNTIDKFPFASNANATDVGDLLSATYGAGQSSAVSGYVTINLDISKFPFATDANATDVGDLSQSRFSGAGQSSTESGYASGGLVPPSYVNTIDKFPFSADANATDVGDLTQARGNTVGQSSTVSGYTSGGTLTPTTSSVVIDKFPFATDANATDVGDLTQARAYAAGQQV
jgi:hypothetical protein